VGNSIAKRRHVLSFALDIMGEEIEGRGPWPSAGRKKDAREANRCWRRPRNGGTIGDRNVVAVPPAPKAGTGWDDEGRTGGEALLKAG